jgi:membrane protein required for colicin V production
MNSVDAFILIFVSVFALRGVWHGLVTELATIVGVIAGYFVALAYNSYLTEFLLTNFPAIGDSASRIISFSVLFIVTNLVVKLIAGMITKTLKIAMLGWLNRLGGALLASGKAIVILSILTILLDLVPMVREYMDGFGLKDSFFYPMLSMLGPELYDYALSLTGNAG